MKSFKYILCLSFCLSLNQAWAGGGWPQKKGRAFIKLSQWWVISDQHFTDMGGIDPNTTYGIFNTSIYGEYGISNRLTGILYAPIFSRAYFNNTVSGTTGEVIIPGEAINSFGDTDIGLKYGLTQGRIATSVSVMLGLPIGENQGGSNNTLQTGDGEFNQLVQFDAGTSFRLGSLPMYANAYMGYNNRTNGFSDEWRFGVEVGATLGKEKWIPIVRLFGVQSLQNGNVDGIPNSTSIFANNSEHLTIAPELNYQFNPKWGVSAGFATALSGRIIFASPSYSVGIFTKI